jgi:hypothetical protein
LALHLRAPVAALCHLSAMMQARMLCTAMLPAQARRTSARMHAASAEAGGKRKEGTRISVCPLCRSKAKGRHRRWIEAARKTKDMSGFIARAAAATTRRRPLIATPDRIFLLHQYLNAANDLSAKAQVGLALPFPVSLRLLMCMCLYVWRTSGQGRCA